MDILTHFSEKYNIMIKKSNVLTDFSCYNEKNTNKEILDEGYPSFYG